jgi:hypothetical protein
MPRRLSPEQRKRDRALIARLEYEAADVDSAVEEALKQALGDFRQARDQLKNYPHIKVTPETTAEAAERGFRAGFILAATAFWDDIALARERRSTAGKGGRSSAAQRQISASVEAQVKPTPCGRRRMWPACRPWSAGRTSGRAGRARRTSASITS